MPKKDAKAAEKSAQETPKETKKPKTAKTTKKATSLEQPIETGNAKVGTMSKQQIIENFATKEGDTGSPEVQIALSTQKVINLTEHLGENPKDNHSRRGLLKIIAKRRRILHYLQSKDEPRYKDLIKKLGLKK